MKDRAEAESENKLGESISEFCLFPQTRQLLLQPFCVVVWLFISFFSIGTGREKPSIPRKLISQADYYQLVKPATCDNLYSN